MALFGLCLPSVALAQQSASDSGDARVIQVGDIQGQAGDFDDVQKAVDAAKPGDFVLIAPGDYHPSGNNGRAGVYITTPDITQDQFVDTFKNNGGFGNPGNGDLAELSITDPSKPSNCWHDNLQADGSQPSSDPPMLQTEHGACNTGLTSNLTGDDLAVPNSGTDEPNLLIQVACNTQALGDCPNTAVADYPRKSQSTTMARPQNETTMPDPCAGPPDDSLCAGSSSGGSGSGSSGGSGSGGGSSGGSGSNGGANSNSNRPVPNGADRFAFDSGGCALAHGGRFDPIWALLLLLAACVLPARARRRPMAMDRR